MAQKISLNGTWNLHWSDGERGNKEARLLLEKPDLRRALSAKVPGEVHLDLIRSGILAEPAMGLNCLSARWVEESIWFYDRAFQAPELHAGERAFLGFDGLDLAAKIHLNGKLAGKHANAFYPCRLEVTSLLKPGENRLLVVLDSGLYSVAERSATGYGMGGNAQLHKRNWLRKTQSTFSWDWAPRLINVGIFGDVFLEVVSKARMDCFSPVAELSEDLQTGRIRSRVFVEGLAEATQKGSLEIAVQETGQSIVKEVEIKPGTQILEAEIILEKPKLWWPVGHGGQNRYGVTACLRVKGEEIGRAAKKIGFRHVRVNQSPHPAGGKYFVIEINHKPIFAKGGNLVPADTILARIDADRYRMLVDRALEATGISGGREKRGRIPGPASCAQA